MLKTPVSKLTWCTYLNKEIGFGLLHQVKELYIQISSEELHKLLLSKRTTKILQDFNSATYKLKIFQLIFTSVCQKTHFPSKAVANLH
jgi:hypothetical protein